MSLLDQMGLPLASLRSYWQRALLTVVGVAVGVSAVVAVAVVGEAGKRLVAREIQSAGDNLFVVGIKGETSLDLAAEGELTIDDAEAVQRSVRAAEIVLPHTSQISAAQTQRGRQRVSVLGTTDRLTELRNNVRVARGRFLSVRDVRLGSRVALMSREVEESLFPRGSAVGQRFFLANTAFSVIGVTQKQNRSLVAGSGPPRVYIPITSFHQLFKNRRIGWLEGKAGDAASLRRAMAQTVALLDRRHHGVNRYAAESLDETVASLRQVIDAVSLVIGAVAAISLFVAAIGVMNVMLVSVTERTSEIGLRKALGARAIDVLGQFLLEALTLCVAGGFVGTTFAAGAAVAIARWMDLPFQFPWSALGLAMAVSLVVGLGAGTYPAARAADLNPIDALREE